MFSKERNDETQMQSIEQTNRGLEKRACKIYKWCQSFDLFHSINVKWPVYYPRCIQWNVLMVRACFLAEDVPSFFAIVASCNIKTSVEHLFSHCNSTILTKNISTAHSAHCAQAHLSKCQWSSRLWCDIGGQRFSFSFCLKCSKSIAHRDSQDLLLLWFGENKKKNTRRQIE